MPTAAQPSGKAGQQPPARPDVVHPHGGDVVGLVADEHAVERCAISREREGHAAVTRAYRHVQAALLEPAGRAAEQVRVDLDADDPPRPGPSRCAASAVV